MNSIIRTDNDNLIDRTELAIGTDPLDADTDGDGLMDGSERYSQSWSTDAFYQIPDDGAVGNPAAATLIIPNIIGNIEHVWVQVGIVHPRCTDVTIKILKNLNIFATKTLASQPEGTMGAYYDCWDLLTMGYTDSDLRSTTIWILLVDDVRSGNQGRIEYF
jgi:hypothetical protein